MTLAAVVKQINQRRDERAANRLFKHIKEKTHNDKESYVQPLGLNDTIRVSTLGMICAREECLASKYEIIRVRFHKPGLRLTFDIGKLFHDMYRNQFFGPMGEWGGAWECSVCEWDSDKTGYSRPPNLFSGKKDVGKISKMPRECPSCGRGDSVRFKEWLIKDEKVGIHGHPDGWSWPEFVNRVLCDLKSQGFRDFSTSRSAKDEHKVQLMGYMHLCGDRQAEVWYMNKSPWGDAPNFIRDIKVGWDVKLFDLLVRKKVDSLRNALNGGVLPDRICIGPEFPRARECQLADVCF